MKVIRKKMSLNLNPPSNFVSLLLSYYFTLKKKLNLNLFFLVREVYSIISLD